MRPLPLNKLFAWLLVPFCLVVALTSCSMAEEGKKGSADEKSTSAETAPLKTDSALRVATADDLQKLIKAARGKVVLLDFWATWCPPCVKGFPHTVKLHERHAKDGLVVISVSMNENDSEEFAEATEFLKKQKASFTNLISHDGGSQQAYEDFGITALPHYILYDRQGNKHDLSGGEDDPSPSAEDLDAAVSRFLAKNSGK